MDVQLRGNPPHRYSVLPDNVNMQQLEQECLQFFESTIDSLDESLEAGEETGQWAPRATDRNGVDGTAFPPVQPMMSSSPAGPSPLLSRAVPPRDHDIIDLVRPGPDLVPPREAFFDPARPDFQSLATVPSSHQEMKPRQDPADLRASEYNPPTGSYRTPDGRSGYCPPGCVPTPVLIAQKIAENQGTSSHIGPSALHHRRSLEAERAPSPAPEHGGPRQGPPTSLKPVRFPANISVVHVNKEPVQSLASVNIHERQAQMLANLPGAEALVGQEEAQQALSAAQKERLAPARSISFRDPTPGKSRMEALSKLGLRSRAASGGEPLYVMPQGRTAEPSAPDPPKDPGSSVAPAAVVAAIAPVPAPPAPAQPLSRPEVRPDRKADPVDPVRSSPERPVHVRPPPAAEVPRSSYPPPPLPTESRPLPAPYAPAPVSLDFNSYGGKTVVIKPAGPSPAAPSGPPDPRVSPPPRVGSNAYGGKSRVMAPRVPRSDLPDILSAHIDRGPPPPPPPPPSEAYGYAGRTVTINPAAGPGAAPRPTRAPAPSTAPKPVRHHSSVSLQRPRAPSPENRRKSMTAKPAAFRAQGVTVQFSGKGAMDDSRRAALRKLGLMKDTG